MTPQELRELAGITTPTATEINKAWAEKQIQQVPVDDVASRLNANMLRHGNAPIQPKMEPTKSDPGLDGLAARLNSLLGSDNFKVQRLN